VMTLAAAPPTGLAEKERKKAIKLTSVTLPDYNATCPSLPQFFHITAVFK